MENENNKVPKTPMEGVGINDYAEIYSGSGLMPSPPPVPDDKKEIKEAKKPDEKQVKPLFKKTEYAPIEVAQTTKISKETEQKKQEPPREEVYNEFLRLCKKQLPNKFIQERNYDPEVCKKIGLGYCEAEVYQQLQEKYNKDLLIKYHLSTDSKWKYVCKTIIPYTDEYFSARPGYGDKKNMFPKDLPKQIWHIPGDKKEVWLVEGEPDAIATKHLYPQADVMCMGGSYAPLQMDQYLLKNRLLKFEKVILCFDNDEPGKKFTEKVKTKLLKDYYSKNKLYICKFDESCKDIDDIYREGKKETIKLEKVELKTTQDLREDFQHAKNKWGMYQETKPQQVIDTLTKLLTKDPNEATEEIVKILESEHHFKTLREDKSKELWVYSGGIYVPNGISFIKQRVRELTNDAYNVKIYNQIVEKIMADTFIDQEEFFKIDDPYKIAVQNGIIDLKTGEIEDFSPDKIHFNKLPVTYDKTKKCPAIIQHFEAVLAEKKKDTLVLQELIGYMLLRNYKYEKAFMLLGDGRNGKGKTIDLIKRFLGSENCVNISLTSLEKNNFAQADLHNKMANLCGDLAKGELRETNKFKEATGGDLISGDRKNKSRIHFVNYAKMVFSANELPKSTDDTTAFMNRWIPLKFPYTFLEKNEYDQKKDKTNFKLRDPEIIQKISTPEELSGLLNWAIEGLKRLEQNKEFSNSSTTAEIRDWWLRHSNSFGSFCLDHIEQSDHAKIPKQTLREVYTDYCKKHKIKKIEDDMSIKKYLTDKFGAGETRIKEEDGTRTVCWKYVKFKDIDGLGQGGQEGQGVLK